MLLVLCSPGLPLSHLLGSPLCHARARAAKTNYFSQLRREGESKSSGEMECQYVVLEQDA